MLLQYNFVFDRADGLAQLNNPNWPQFVSTITPPEGDELAKGTYRPLLAPVNFNQSKPGEKYFTVWYAGPLLDPQRPRTASSSSRAICSASRRMPAAPATDVPANPSLPDYQRDVQFTVNGLFQPVIKSKAGQTEIWVLAQCQRHRLHERAAHRNGDGQASQDRHRRPGRQSLSRRSLSRHSTTARGCVIPPATRYAIAVTMPDEGDLVLEMPPRGGGAQDAQLARHSLHQ